MTAGAPTCGRARDPARRLRGSGGRALPRGMSFARYAWAVLIYNLAVVSWGAFVRATGSGAGCGRHWPMCNGQVVPRTAAVETALDFTPRTTSGLVEMQRWFMKLAEKQGLLPRNSVREKQSTYGEKKPRRRSTARRKRPAN